MMMNTPINKHNLDEIISTFGKREAPNEAMMQKARVNVHAHWQASIKQQKRQKLRRSILAIAASFFALGAVLLVLQSQFSVSKPSTFAEIAFSQGSVQVSNDNKTWQTLNNNTAIKTGQWLKTQASSYANVTLNDGSQIRLNTNTQLQFDVINHMNNINLVQGEIYHDADNANAKELTIHTPLATIEHIGTRYAVALKDSKLEVKVRNGLVKLASDAITTTLDKGKLLELTATGKVTHNTVTSYDNSWAWTKKASQPMNVNHQNLASFITWYAHENGLQVDWNRQKQQAEKVELSGDFAQLNDEQLLKTVFLSTKFDFEINQGILTIRP